MDAELSEQLFSAEQLAMRVGELGRNITQDFKTRDLVVIGVLKGSAFFTSDLARAIDLPISIDWVAVSTYGDGSSVGVPRLLKDVGLPITGRDILIVDDILDTGTTLAWLRQHLAPQNPASISSCVLLRKPDTGGRRTDVEYVGFDITVDWVAGYGIDYAERHRGRADISAVRLPAQAQG